MMRYTILMALALASCAWSRPGTTQVEFQRDSYECEQEAARTYPVNVAQAPPSNQLRCTTMYGQTNCLSSPTPSATAGQDLNAGARATARMNCLKARGYSLGAR